jgi:hypothetical protein
MKSSSTANDRFNDLNIAEGVKQLLVDANFTIESILDLGYRKVSETLHVDLYIGKLIVEAAQNSMQDRSQGQTSGITQECYDDHM